MCEEPNSMNAVENNIDDPASEAVSACMNLLTDQYHTKCHDCGRFLKKKLWVPKDHKWKAHGLCKNCFDLYDPPEY